MVYFKFLSENTDIGLRISFKESGLWSEIYSMDQKIFAIGGPMM